MFTINNFFGFVSCYCKLSICSETPVICDANYYYLNSPNYKIFQNKLKIYYKNVRGFQTNKCLTLV